LIEHKRVKSIALIISVVNQTISATSLT